MSNIKESIKNYVEKRRELNLQYMLSHSELMHYDYSIGILKTNRTLTSPRVDSYLDKKYLTVSNNECLLYDYLSGKSNIKIRNGFNNNFDYYPFFNGSVTKRNIQSLLEQQAKASFDLAIKNIDTFPQTYEKLNSDLNDIVKKKIDSNYSKNIEPKMFEKYKLIINRFIQIKTSLSKLREKYIEEGINAYLSGKKSRRLVVTFLFIIGFLFSIGGLYIGDFVKDHFSTGTYINDIPIENIESISIVLMSVGTLFTSSSFFYFVFSCISSALGPSKPSSSTLKAIKKQRAKLCQNIDSLTTDYNKTYDEYLNLFQIDFINEYFLPLISKKENEINDQIDNIVEEWKQKIKEINQKFNPLIDINEDILTVLDKIQLEELDMLYSLGILATDEKELIDIYYKCKEQENRRVAYEAQIEHQKRLEEENIRHNRAVELENANNSTILKKQLQEQSEELRRQTAAYEEAAYYSKQSYHVEKERAEQEKKQLKKQTDLLKKQNQILKK